MGNRTLGISLKSLPFMLVSGVLALAGCQGATYQNSGGAVVDSSFHVTGFRWDGGGTVYIFAKAQEKNGLTEICGAWAPEQMNVYVSRLNDRAIESVILMSDGDKLVQSGRWMKKFIDPKESNGQAANCILSDVPWKAVYAEDINSKVGSGTF